MNSLRQVNSTVLYTSPYCQIEHIPFCKTIYYTLKGYLQEDEALDFFETVLYFIEKKQSQNLVAELSEFKGTHMNMAKYANQLWSQKLARYGIRRVAIILPKSKFGEFCSKIAAGREAHTYLSFREFNHLQDSLTWICFEAGVLPHQP
jgi:hypothetical protein